MKKYFFTVFVLLALGGVWIGCAKKNTTPGSVFNSAASEIKSGWDQAVAADQANDYVTAITGYRNLTLQGSKLTHEQMVTANDALLAINQRLNVAKNSGDAAAAAAFGKLNQTPARP